MQQRLGARSLTWWTNRLVVWQCMRHSHSYNHTTTPSSPSSNHAPSPTHWIALKLNKNIKQDWYNHIRKI
jgi:hypothetical protein